MTAYSGSCPRGGLSSGMSATRTPEGDGTATVPAPVDWLEELCDLRLPKPTDRRLTDLMDRNNEGQLDAAELAELEQLAQASANISIIRARAMHLLGRRLA